MFPDPSLTLADLLLRIADVFSRTLAPEARARRVGLFQIAILKCVQRFERRFCALYALWKAGRAPKARGRREDSSPRPSPRRGEREAAGAVFDPLAAGGASWEMAFQRPASVLPRTMRWMQAMLPGSAAVLAGEVDSLMRNYPEMREFAADCPQVGRILRPICAMAGIRPADYLALPKRRRVRKNPRALSAADEAELARITARFPDTPAARSGKRALRRMFERRPVRLDRMSAVARGYFLHPPRDGNCPPPEIGYGGRMFAPLPKGYRRPMG